MSQSVHVREEGRGTALADYWPLICLIFGAALGAVAIASGFGDMSAAGLMHAFMGLFLFVFALLKLFDLEGFKDGFAMYDLAARRVRGWGYVYPFVELALALAYFSFVAPDAVYVATIAVFAFGAVGVISALRRGLDIDCPCMGNILSVPLSTVTLTEDIGMAAMAAIMLAM